MKRIGLLLMIMVACIARPHAQEKAMETLSLGVGTDKTTNLVFPYPIISGVRGSRDILTQKAKGAENVLLLKASKDDFKETSLSVITADGALYSFLVAPTPYPELNVDLGKALPDSRSLVALSGAVNASSTGQTAASIAVKQAFYHNTDRNAGASLSLKGIYIREDILYFQLGLKNDTGIAYDVSQFRIYIKDKKVNKRTAEQELEQEPLFIYGNSERIDSRAEQTIVVALSKFTLAGQKKLILQIQEKDGGRNLELEIPNKKIIRARAVQ